jgi:ribose transport system substrate-binding protein
MIPNKHRATALAFAAIPAAAALILTGCSSASVGAGTTSTPAATANAYASIIPSGDIVAASKKLVADSLSASTGFSPKSSGPKAQQAGATIAYVGSDLTNGGVNTVAEGVKEAAAVIGWKDNVYDGKATAQGRTDALNQAIASKPAAIVLGGFDPTEQAATIKTANDAKIPVVGWHAGASTGPGNGLFANVSTDPLAVSQLAAAFAVADSNGKAGVAIFTDGQYQIAVEKAKAMQAYITACSGCSVLSYQDSPIADADQRMPGIISNLLQKDGDKLTYLLAINGNYFGGAQQALRAAGKDPAGTPKSVAAGDGDSAEFQRIRSVDYQAATVAEPLTMEGWEIVDEVNRALAGQQWSGFVPAPGLITKQNVPTGDVFDPASGYRDVYKKVWGK